MLLLTSNWGKTMLDAVVESILENTGFRLDEQQKKDLVDKLAYFDECIERISPFPTISSRDKVPTFMGYSRVSRELRRSRDILPHLIMDDAALKILQKYGDELWRHVNPKKYAVDCFHHGSNLVIFSDGVDDPESKEFLVKKAISYMESALKKIFWDLDGAALNRVGLARAYARLYNLTRDEEFKRRAVDNWRLAFNCSPKVRSTRSYEFGARELEPLLSVA